MKPAVLVYGQLPPPQHGSNVMTRHFLTALEKSGVEAVLSRKSLSADVADVNRIRPVKVFRLAATWARFAANLFRVRPVLAVIFASSTLVGLAAESVVAGLCRLAAVPYLLYLHTDVHRQVARAPFPLRQIVSSVFCSAEACLVLGRVFRNEMMALWPVRVFVLPNCVEENAPAPEETIENGPPKVLFLSNIERSKGILTLLRAVPRVLGERPETIFSIVGPWKGPAIRREVEATIARDGTARAVYLAGEAYGERKSAIMARHDIFVLPSLRDAMSLSVLEAMRDSLPVVSSDVGAMSEVVTEGITGYLVPAGDPEALARRILDLARSVPKRLAMGRAGRDKYVREFIPAVYERNVRDVLNAVMARRAVP